ncbi:MAG TPA: transglycosylase SLT domain-containing protein [Candidatus Binatia bacterium]
MLVRVRCLLVTLTLIAIPLVSLAQAPTPRENFAEAYPLYSNGNLTQAKVLFQQALEPDFLLADYSLYYLALISLKEDNFDEAKQLLSQLRSRYPQSIWFHPAQLQQAKIDLAEKNFTQADETLRALRSETGVKSEIVDEAIFLQAQGREAVGAETQAHGLYSELRARSPRSRWTAQARAAVRRLREKYPEQFGLNTTEAIADEADRLVREGETGDAEVLYKKLLTSNSEPTFRRRILTKLTDLYLSVRKRSEAIPFLEQIARDYPKSPEASKALYQIGQIFWNRHENARALDYFRQVMERYPTSAYVERSRYAVGDIYESFGRKQDAIAVYTSIIKNFPNSQVHDDAASRLAWLYYRDQEWSRAYATFQRLAGKARDSGFRMAGLYWQGRSAEKLGDVEGAIRIYQQIVDGNEESYYQALAVRALSRQGITVDEAITSPLAPVDEVDPPMSAEMVYHLTRARELASLTLHRLAVAEVSEVDRLAKNQSGLRRLVMREYFDNHAYGRSLAIANQLPSSQGDRNLYRFPLAYWEMIQQKAQGQELDPYLVLALIRQESLFDPQARSPAAALGLMQLLPSTAARVAKQIGVAPPSNEQLFQPEVNLVLGTQYLKDLLQRYSGDWFKAIAAYNAGEAAVDRWDREIHTDDAEEFVERIPYLETRGYVKLVMRNHRIYKRLYNQPK